MDSLKGEHRSNSYYRDLANADYWYALGNHDRYVPMVNNNLKVYGSDDWILYTQWIGNCLDNVPDDRKDLFRIVEQWSLKAYSLEKNFTTIWCLARVYAL